MPRALQAGSRVVLLLGAAACGPEQQIDFPTPMFQASPIPYPIELWDQNLNGETVVLVHVTDIGGVDSVVLHDSSGYEAFDSAAVQGARDLRFMPGRVNGKRKAMWARVPVRFERDRRTAVEVIGQAP